jgi:hypothetical protein
LLKYHFRGILLSVLFQSIGKNKKIKRKKEELMSAISKIDEMIKKRTRYPYILSLELPWLPVELIISIVVEMDHYDGVFLTGGGFFPKEQLPHVYFMIIESAEIYKIIKVGIPTHETTGKYNWAMYQYPLEKDQPESINNKKEDLFVENGSQLKKEVFLTKEILLAIALECYIRKVQGVFIRPTKDLRLPVVHFIKQPSVKDFETIRETVNNAANIFEWSQVTEICLLQTNDKIGNKKLVWKKIATYPNV